MNTKMLLGATALAALLATATVHAQVQPTPPAERAPMTMVQAIERVTALGYTDVREVERKGAKMFEVKARDAQGRWVELTLDARTGEVLRSEFDH